MSSSTRFLGNADTQYNDWRGTVALDDGDADLYAIFKLDREKWAILGLSLFGTFGDSSWGSAYAADAEMVRNAREAHGDDWPAAIAGENDGHIPVTEFDLDPEQNALDVLFQHKQWSVRAMPTWITDQSIDLGVVSSPDDLMTLE